MKIKHLILILFTSICIAQSAIIPAGNSKETFGEVIPSMQQFDTIIEVKLGNPTFELPKEEPKPTIKKKISFLERILNFFKSIFKK